MDIAYLSDTGLKREHNEDSVLIDKSNNIYIVADGMGGHRRGEVASRILVESFCDSSKNYESITGAFMDENTVVPKSSIDTELNGYIHLASQKIKEYALKESIDGIIGSTIVGMKYIKEVNAWAVFHLGDSRAYLFNNNSLIQLTRDHSKHELMRRENATEEEISNSGKNIITRAVGNFDPFPLEIRYINNNVGDLYMLCSDGVSDVCTNDELLRLYILYGSNLEFMCTQIKNLVYSRGAKDNLSIVLLRSI